MTFSVIIPGAAGQILAVASIVLFFAYYGWYFPRSRSVLRHWASQNGFEIIHARFRWLFKGPYFWMSYSCQTVYRVKVRDRHGNERSGWVCCGGIFSGLFSNEAEVTWDHDDTAAARKRAENWKHRIRTVADTTESPDDDMTFDEFCEFTDDKILEDVVRELKRMPSGKRHLKEAYENVTKKAPRSGA